MLEYVDFGPNPHVEQFGRFGALQVRWAKGTKGSGPRRRTVLTVPEFDWVVGLLEHWLSPDGRKRFPTADRSASLWPSERSGSTVFRNFDRSFQRVRTIAGLPEELTLHTLRHSYVTHLIEAGYDPLFIQLIWGRNRGVFDVQHEARNRTVPRDGGAYLKLSITRDRGRVHAGSTSFGVRFAA
jgi:hypothetical protein